MLRGQLIIDDTASSFQIIQDVDEVVWSQELDFTGLEMILALTYYMRYMHQMLIGKLTAERVILEIGTLLPSEREAVYPVKGRNMVTGLPATKEISSTELGEVLLPAVHELVGELNFMLNIPVYERMQENSSMPSQVPEALREVLRHNSVLLMEKTSLPRGLGLYLQQELGFSFQ